MADDLDDLVEEHIADILFFVLGLFLLQIGMRLWGMMPPSAPTAAIAIILTFAWGMFLMVISIFEVDTGDYGHRLAAISLAIILLGVLSLWVNAPDDFLGTDVILFTREAVEITLAGENPYEQSMLPAVGAVMKYDTSIPGVLTAQVTPMTDGGTVEQVSYPAGSYIVFLPQAVLYHATGLGRPELLMTLAASVSALAALLVRVTPPELAALPLLVMIAPRDFFFASLGGLNDVLWVLPVVVAMLYWAHDRWVLAGIAFGVAGAMKQQPWFIAPFLAIWIHHATPGWRAAARRLAKFAGPAAAAFAAINLPFILWGPQAWLEGVLTPLRETSGALIMQGSGLVLLTVGGIVALPKWYYLGLMAGLWLLLLALYALYFERVKWMAWMAPSLVLFVNYRSLPSYFFWMAPIAYTAFLLQTGLYWRGDYWTLVVPERWQQPTAGVEVAD